MDNLRTTATREYGGDSWKEYEALMVATAVSGIKIGIYEQEFDHKE